MPATSCGQFVNVRLKVETLPRAIVVPTSAVQRGPAGTFSYVIGEGNVVTAKPVTVTQQNEHEAVIASGLTTSDRVVTTGFANLADGSKVVVGTDDGAPTADLAPRKRSRQGAGQATGQGAASGEAQGKDGKRDWQGKNGEHRGRHEHGDGDQKGQTGPAPATGGEQSGGGAPKAQP
jgi:multidrug efflux system membrane fusion protein